METDDTTSPLRLGLWRLHLGAAGHPLLELSHGQQSSQPDGSLPNLW